MRQISRRHFLHCGAATVGYMAATSRGFARRSSVPMPNLPVADLTTGANAKYDMMLQNATHDFGMGALSDTFGINANYLGSVVRVKRGQAITFNVHNKIGELTALHWHGLHIPGAVDGGPHQSIKPGETWSPTLHINQPASLTGFTLIRMVLRVRRSSRAGGDVSD